ncbi:lipopolysaccharide biosynthesis protein [Ventrimonas sp. CLA-AP-H27]|uniref:Lipopolysaccharide biosynthesis protein n=1 Tax=Ventrimonas faecis TaxID=3133170 RepID=A0ABV1HNG5_9FIRM
MEDNKVKNSALSNLAWRFAERCGAQGVAFIVSIVLARILSPDAYGTIALITVFTNILNVFIDSGLGNALIQKKSADDLDFSTVFFFNILMCCVLYMGLFLTAPVIAQFYNDDSLTPVIRVLGITLIISGVKNVQQAYVSRTLQFKKFFFATLGGTIGAAILGIVVALNGGGVWALVVQQIFNAAVDTIILWFTVSWKPRLIFSLERLRGLFSYGWKLLVSSLLDTIYNNLEQLIIGKVYSNADLAYYNRGRQFPNFMIANINNSIDSVLLPVMSRAQDDKSHIKAMTRRSIKTSTYVMAPMMMGLAFCAEPIIRLVLTDKWLPCVPFLRIFCCTFMFYPIHTANLNAIKAMGRSDLFLKLEIEKKIVGIILLFSTMWFGVLVMAYGLLINSVMCQIINSWPNRKLLNYGYWEQLKDIMPGILLALTMGLCVNGVNYLGFSDFVTLVIQIPLGVVIFVGLSAVLKLESFEYLKDIVMSSRKK